MGNEAVVFFFVYLLYLYCILMSCTGKFECVSLIFLLGTEKVVAVFVWTCANFPSQCRTRWFGNGLNRLLWELFPTNEHY